MAAEIAFVARYGDSIGSLRWSNLSSHSDQSRLIGHKRKQLPPESPGEEIRVPKLAKNIMGGELVHEHSIGDSRLISKQVAE